MAKQEYEVKELVSKIQHGEIKLPEMQRTYVWSATRVRDLLDSIYRGYPSGTILTWETSGDIPIRDLSIEQEKLTTYSFQLLLDGQQRLTSLSAILLGEPIYVKGRERSIDILFNLDHPEEMQVVTEVDEDISDEDEDPEIVDASEEDISKQIEQMAFNVKTNSLANQPQWVSVTEVLKDSSSDSQILKKCGIKDLEDPRYKKYTYRLNKLRAIKQYKYDVHVLGRDKSYEEVTEIFVRVNSLGAKLSGSDLALAQVTAKWQGSLKIFEEFKKDCQDADFNCKLGIFIRNLIVFTTGQSKFKTVSSLSQANLKKGWEKSKKGFLYALNFLKNNVGIDNSALLSTSSLIIILGYFAQQNDFTLSPEMEQKLRYWLLVANAKGRYSRGSSESLLDQDLASIRKDQSLLTMEAHLRTQFGRLDVQPDDLFGKNSRSAYFKTMFLIFKKDGAQEWFDSLGISLNHSGVEYKLQFHHIFPQALLKNNHCPKEKINDIANLCFISGETNRKISNKSPAKYIPEIIEQQREDALTKQCIPTDKDLWELKNYDKFLQQRRLLIVQKINEFIGNNPFGDTDQLQDG